MNKNENKIQEINNKFLNIANTNIRISNIKNYGISQTEKKNYFVKVKQYTHTTKEKFLFFKYNEDHFEYSDKLVPIHLKDNIPYLKLPNGDYELVIAENFYDDEECAFYLSQKAWSITERGFIDANGGNWKDFVAKFSESCSDGRYYPYLFFDLVETKEGKIKLDSYTNKANAENNLIIERSIVKYLYITTYQNDNYTFYESDSVNVLEEKEKLDKIFSVEQ